MTAYTEQYLKEKLIEKLNAVHVVSYFVCLTTTCFHFVLRKNIIK